MALRGRWTRLVCGSNGTGMSCMLNIDRQDANTGSFHLSQTILFNCGDSTQQACLQSRIKLHKLSCIVFTSISAHNICGLLGIIHALSDLGVEKVQLVGPPGLKGFVEAMGIIVKRRFPELIVREVNDAPDSEGSSVSSVSLHESLMMETYAIRFKNNIDQGAIGVGYSIRGLNCSVWPVDSSLTLTPSFAQLAETKRVPTGLVVFVPLSISALLFSRSRMLNSLEEELQSTSIGSLFLLDGEWSDEVIEFPRSQQTTLLAHTLCPHLFPRAFPAVEAAAESAASAQNQVDYQNSSPSMQLLEGVDEEGEWVRISSDSEIHAVEANIGMMECLVSQEHSGTQIDASVGQKRSFFGVESSASEKLCASVATKHLLSMKVSGISLTAPAPPPAPVPVASPTPAIAPVPGESNHAVAALLRSKLKPARTETPPVANTSTPTGADERTVSLIGTVPPPTPFDFDFTFLGTGSAMPSKLRANSAILFKFPSIASASGATTAPAAGANPIMHSTSFSMLLDSGEGVSRQMFQSVSGDKSRFVSILLSIGIIWISHHHADHLCGLPQLIENIYRARWHQIRQNTRKKKTEDSSSTSATFQPTVISDWPRVIVYASASSITYIEYALNISGLDDIVDIQPLTNTVFAGATCSVFNRSQGRIQRLRSVAVYHCRESYGLVLDLWNGFKFVYSGDCRPSEALMGAGSDCDLLIHEATFADDCSDHAVIKKHCTVSEALAVASSMRVKRLTVLTHFSQRYAIRPKVAPVATTQDTGANTSMERKERFAVAFDFLHFSFPSQCAVLPEVTASLGEALEKINTHLQQQLDS